MVAVTLLETRGLTRRFGGIEAVRDVDLAIEAGEIRAIIGPNGAGKTTLVGMICGRLTPTSGTIQFEGRAITALPDFARARLGIVYTFQITSIFKNLTVHDNVALAAQRRLTLQRSVLKLDQSELRAASEAALDRVGLAERRHDIAATLAYGHQRLLEVAMSLALQPKLLILDEPTQGLAADEIAAFCTLVRDIAAATTVLLIEHNMDVVMALASRITVMSRGRVLAEGAPDAIRADRDVQEAYLGS